MKELLDADLRESLEDAERSQVELARQYEQQRAEGRPLTRADELALILMRFEVQLTEASVQHEQARRHGLIHDDGYDRQLLGAEAGVIDLCSQLIDVLARGDMARVSRADVLARLERGLASVRNDREFAKQHGWAYRREKWFIATRERAWEKAIKEARRQ